MRRVAIPQRSYPAVAGQATSVTGLTLHLAIVACFVFWWEIYHPASSDFCNEIGTY